MAPYVKPHKPVQSNFNINVQEIITVKEIRENNLSERVTKAIECVYATIGTQNRDDDEKISLQISVRYLQKPPSSNVSKKPPSSNVNKKTQEGQPQASEENVKEVVKSLEEALQQHLEKKKKLTLELAAKIKQVREEKEREGNAGDELETALEAHLQKREKLSVDLQTKMASKSVPETDDKVSGAEVKGSTEDIQESVTKIKKHKRRESDTLNDSNVQNTIPSKKQKRGSVAEVFEQISESNVAGKTPKKSKRKNSQGGIEQQLDSSLEQSSMKTPKNKKRNSANVLGDQTPENNDDSANNSLKSSKKKHKKRQSKDNSLLNA